MDNQLSVAEMNAAIMARACDADPNFKTGLETARSLANMPYDRNNQPDRRQFARNQEELEEKYRLGQRVLERYTLRLGHKSTVHTMADGKIPGEDEGVSTLRVEAGYVGTMQAYHTAIFNPR